MSRRHAPAIATGGLFAALFLCPFLAEGSAGRVVLPSAGDSVVAGTTAEVRWEALDLDIEEFELLLSVDEAQRRFVRLTPQLDPVLGRYVWVVPNLPSTAARLRLRVGRGGEEIECGPSEAFRIVGRPDLAATALHFAAGEWWAVDRIAAPPEPDRVPVVLTLKSPRNGRRAAVVASRNLHEFTPPAADPGLPGAGRAPAGAAPTSSAAGRVPRVIPQRE